MEVTTPQILYCNAKSFLNQTFNGVKATSTSGAKIWSGEVGWILVGHGSTTSDFKAKRTVKTVPVSQHWLEIERMKVTEHN